jgi:hypothetical protein
MSMGRDRRLDELARIEFTGSLGEAFGRYAYELREVSTRWDTELGLASTDVFAALSSARSPWLLGLDGPVRRARARRVARRLRRAQALAASLAKRAQRFPKEYAKHFVADPEIAKRIAKELPGGRS